MSTTRNISRTAIRDQWVLKYFMERGIYRDELNQKIWTNAGRELTYKGKYHEAFKIFGEDLEAMSGLQMNKLHLLEMLWEYAAKNVWHPVQRRLLTLRQELEQSPELQAEGHRALDDLPDVLGLYRNDERQQIQKWLIGHYERMMSPKYGCAPIFPLFCTEDEELIEEFFAAYCNDETLFYSVPDDVDPANVNGKGAQHERNLSHAWVAYYPHAHASHDKQLNRLDRIRRDFEPLRIRRPKTTDPHRVLMVASTEKKRTDPLFRLEKDMMLPMKPNPIEDAVAWVKENRKFLEAGALMGAINLVEN